MNYKQSFFFITSLILAAFAQGQQASGADALHSEQASKVPRAMWVWETKRILRSHEQDVLLDFCGQKNISILYLYTGSESFFEHGETLEALKSLLYAANRRGIEVEALDGWPEAVLPHEQDRFVDSLQRVLDYNRSVESEYRFAGFQSDVEPFVMAGYSTDPAKRESINLLFLELHEKLRHAIDTENVDNFRFGIALSPHYESNGDDFYVLWNNRPNTVAVHMLEIVDYATLMSYRDTATATIQIAEHEIEVGNHLGKPIWVGCETLDIFGTSQGPRSITFYEEGSVYMEEQLAQVSDHFSKELSFAGLAIHYYDSYRKLPESGKVLGESPAGSAQALPADAVVDGVFDEWADKPALEIKDANQVIYGRRTGPADLSGSYWLGWTHEALYFKIIVADDVLLQFQPDAMLWEGDHVEIWLEAPALDRVYQFGFTPGDFEAMPPHTWVWFPEELDQRQREQVRTQLSVAAVKLDGHGYQLEGSIPASALGIDSFRPGMELRMSFEIGDADSKDKPHEALISISPVFNRNRPTSFALIKLAEE
jgi:uncharacterized protein YeaC (DUF1315 family)